MVSKDWKGGKFDIVDIEVEPLGDPLTNFMSFQFKLKVTVKEVGGGRFQNFHYFMKSLPNVEGTRADYIKAIGAFHREFLFYSEISSDLKVNEISGEEGFKCIPAFYLAKEDSIVMEDLTAKGYTMIGSRTALGLEHCSLVLKALANFHAATIIFEERKKEESPHFVNICDNPRYELEDALHAPVYIQGKSWEWMQSSFSAFPNLLKILPKYKDDEEMCRRISEKLPMVHQTSLDLVRRSERFRNVVCHGDLWSNNIMFTHDESGKPDGLKFLDYQFVRYLPPTTDIMFFLYTSTRRQFREENEENLLRLYHNQLMQTLTTHGLSRDLLPEEQFRESCDEMRQLGRIMSAVYALTILMPDDFLPAVLTSEEENMRFSFDDRSPEVCKCFHTDEIFRERSTEIMEEFIEYCVIPLL